MDLIVGIEQNKQEEEILGIILSEIKEKTVVINYQDKVEEYVRSSKPSVVLIAIESAMAAAYRKDFGNKLQNIITEFDPKTGDVKVFDVKTVVENVPEEGEETTVSEETTTTETKAKTKQKKAKEEAGASFAAAFAAALKDKQAREEEEKSGGTITGYKETVYSLGTTSGTITPNVANGNVQSITLDGNLTLNAFTTPIAGQSLTLIITTGSTGRTLTSSMLFAGGEKTLSITSTVDIISIFYDGTTYWASLSKDFK
jgi:hypothetical protein